jgi:ABC-type uncharacterized transport system permease subunit
MTLLIQVWILGMLRGGTSLMLTSLGGLLSERSGVINIGLEGMMLLGAFAGAVVSYFTKSALLGLSAAVLAGGLLAYAHAVLTQRLKVEHVMSGIALNLVALGVTSFLLRRLPDGIGSFSKVPSVPWWSLTIVACVLMGVIYVWLNYTPSGIRLQAVGNDAEKAAQVGIDPIKVRYFGVIASGMLAGLGGGYLSLAQTPGFSVNMSSGRGYIALAALILGRWNPFGAAAAALAFGLFYQAEEWMQGTPIFGVQLPTEFWLSLPYLLTVIALAGFRGRSKPPADLGKT